MAKKEFKFRSKTLSELQQLSLDEVAELLPSRRRRTIKRGLSDDHKQLLAKIERKDNVQTHLRDMIIFPKMVGKTVKVYTGQQFQPVTIQPEMIGHVLGEFALTRKRATHTSVGVTNKPKK